MSRTFLTYLLLVVSITGCSAAKQSRVETAPTLAPAPFTQSSVNGKVTGGENTEEPAGYEAGAGYHEEIASLTADRARQRARVLTGRLEQERDDVDTRIALARLLMEEGHEKAAIQPLRDALFLQPSRDDVASLLTHAYVQAGRGGAALELAGRLVARAESEADRWILLGEVQRKLGREKQAEHSASQALLLDPEAYAARAILATIHADRGNVPLARKLWQELRGKQGVEQHVVAYRLARLALDEGRFMVALEHLDAAIREKSTFAPALNDRGLVYARLSRPEEAERDFSAAVEAAPEFAEAQLNLANLRIERDLPDEASDLLEKAGSLGVERKAYTVAAARFHALDAASARGRAQAIRYLSEARTLVSGDTLLAVERAIAKLESLPPPDEPKPPGEASGVEQTLDDTGLEDDEPFRAERTQEKDREHSSVEDPGAPVSGAEERDVKPSGVDRETPLSKEVESDSPEYQGESDAIQSAPVEENHPSTLENRSSDPDVDPFLPSVD